MKWRADTKKGTLNANPTSFLRKVSLKIMLYAITVSAGLETIAREELSERFADTGHLKNIERKPQRILFQYTGNPREIAVPPNS